MSSVSGIKEFLKKEASPKLLVLFVIGLAILIILQFFGECSKEVGESGAEERLAELCSAVDGAGECRIMISYNETNTNTVDAVAIIYTGGGGIKTESELKELISSLYGIGTNRIAVISAEKQQKQEY